MKKFLLSFVIFMSVTSVHNSLAVNVPAGYESAEWISSLAAKQNTTDSELMRKLILIQHSPLFSLLGGAYFGVAFYTALSAIENTSQHRDPESLERNSLHVRKFLKIIASVPFALFGAWISARTYQNWKACESILYNPPIVP
jgi:hypothetical protein